MSFISKPKQLCDKRNTLSTIGIPTCTIVYTNLINSVQKIIKSACFVALRPKSTAMVSGRDDSVEGTRMTVEIIS